MAGSDRCSEHAAKTAKLHGGVPMRCMRCRVEINDPFCKYKMVGFYCSDCARIIGDEARARARASMAAEQARAKHGA